MSLHPQLFHCIYQCLGIPEPENQMAPASLQAWDSRDSSGRPWDLRLGFPTPGVVSLGFP